MMEMSMIPRDTVPGVANTATTTTSGLSEVEQREPRDSLRVVHGLSTDEANKNLELYGKNEIPTIHVSILHLFLMQFVGTMPYILEICLILAAAALDW